MDLACDTLPAAKVAELERAMLATEGHIDCPVTHHFGPGIYIRDIFIPAGTLAIGHAHKGPCLNELLKGEMRVVTPDGDVKTIAAPHVFVSGAGRKVAFAITDCVFRNLHATDETDLDRLEEQLIEKSEAWLDHHLADAARLLEGND